MEWREGLLEGNNHHHSNLDSQIISQIKSLYLWETANFPLLSSQTFWGQHNWMRADY